MVRTSETPPGMAGLAKFVPGGNIRESATTPAPNQPEISLAPEKAFHFRKNAEAARLPAPLVFLEVDLRRFSFMPVHVDLLLRSEFVAKASADVFRRALLLWCACWHEVPAASLPDDDMVLAKLAHYRGSMKKFRRLKPKILYGFVFCSDGRWYHKFISNLALEAWKGKLSQTDRTKSARIVRLANYRQRNSAT